MKKKLLLFSLFISSCCFSQSRLPTTNQEPDYYIDSIKVHPLGVFDIGKVESINVVKNSTVPNGKVYIKIKKDVPFNLITAADIIRIYKIDTRSASIIMLDDEIIKDTSDFKIDLSYILKVEVVKAPEIKYLPANNSNLIILKITTATQANIEKEKSIRLKGGNSPA